jgi:hypothetical protein
LYEQPLHEPEITACDPNDCGHGLRVAEVGVVKIEAKLAPSSRQD